MKTLKRKPKRSLRTILLIWFFLFSVLPLVFVSLYSIEKFEQAIDNEMSQRLSGNAREVEVFLNELKSGLEQKRDKYIADPSLVYHTSMQEGAPFKAQLMQWLKNDSASGLTLFGRDGRMLVSVFKDDNGQVRSFLPTQDAVFLSATYMSQAKDKKDLSIAEFREKNKINLILISRIKANNGRVVGYLEQVADLDKALVNRLNKRLKLELIFIKDDGKVIVASHNDLYKFIDSQKFNGLEKKAFLNIRLKNEPYGFFVYPIDWGITKFYVALGASKDEAKYVLKEINIAFISVVSIVFLLLIVTIVVTSSWLLKPLYELVEALQSFESQEKAVTIPVKNDTEIGLLTESFNEMSKKISQARGDIRGKITELEKANRELKDTQTKLVHSAKMVSLGQLVAGVAHELNNPIGFIYSNMTHLKDYSERLIQLVRTAQDKPQDLAQQKEDLEFDYVVQDLPKLIASCQDGARRTRDIVLGLRNFSRLEEAKLQEMDIRQSIDTTLNLLQGEIKNRIEVHKHYEPTPMVNCYVSQINQVLMNILSNAVQSVEGTGNIWISTQSLKEFKGKKNGCVQISIQDSGKGMSAETLEKIFDPFFTTKGVGQGTGLGLSISYGIIQNHGGEIQVRSEEGVGTEFTVVIPIFPPTDKDSNT